MVSSFSPIIRRALIYGALGLSGYNVINLTVLYRKSLCPAFQQYPCKKNKATWLSVKIKLQIFLVAKRREMLSITTWKIWFCPVLFIYFKCVYMENRLLWSWNCLLHGRQEWELDKANLPIIVYLHDLTHASWLLSFNLLFHGH